MPIEVVPHVGWLAAAMQNLWEQQGSQHSRLSRSPLVLPHFPKYLVSMELGG